MVFVPSKVKAEEQASKEEKKEGTVADAPAAAVRLMCFYNVPIAAAASFTRPPGGRKMILKHFLSNLTIIICHFSHKKTHI
jgi:hypothetical protein